MFSAKTLTSHYKIHKLNFMKILSAEQIREVDKKTVEYENISSLELMERAAMAFFDWFVERYQNKSHPIAIVVGVGNNGGDGLVVTRLLEKSGYRAKVWVAEYSTKYSEDFSHNFHQIRAENIWMEIIASENDIPDFSDFGIIIDAIFGTGISREVTGFTRKLIEQINKSGKTIVSIDVPSGMYLDKKTDFAVQATETVTFEIPKLPLLVPDNHQFTGNITIVPIGLNKRAIEEAQSLMFFIDKEFVKNRLKPLQKLAHKGTQGHALIIGGSLGKSGAVCLASKAALKSGCGLVTAYVPKCTTAIVPAVCPEAMVLEDESENYISNISFDLKPNAIGVGVGLGKHPQTAEAFHRFLQQNKSPIVIDADGLNILSENKEWLKLLPQNTILTPHPKELSRLIGEWGDDFEKIEKVKEFSLKYSVIVVVKGAHTLVIDGEKMYVNSSGTPALATAGSGDVLTGIITGLLAQGYSPIDAAIIGVFLHGYTADITQNIIHPRSFVASDIIENIGNAYFEIEK